MYSRNDISNPKVQSSREPVFTSPGDGRQSLSLMPPEMIRMIASNLPPSARASLALTCKGFLDTLLPLDGLALPREQPPNFQDVCMSLPQLYQLERWAFLRLLEVDLSQKWLLCFDCFSLHPSRVFRKTHQSLFSWLRDGWDYLSLQRQPRSCYHPMGGRNAKEAVANSSSGVIDICPCIKLTPANKQAVQVKVPAFERAASERDDNLKRPFHTCTCVYDDMAIIINVGFYNSAKSGDLGATVMYQCTPPRNPSSKCPRMICPHIALDTLIRTVLRCRDMDLHPLDKACARCRDLRHCRICHSIVFDFRSMTNSTGTLDAYRIDVDRKLGEKNWREQRIFPYARQRRYGLRRGLSDWKLW